MQENYMHYNTTQMCSNQINFYVYKEDSSQLQKTNSIRIISTPSRGRPSASSQTLNLFQVTHNISSYLNILADKASTSIYFHRRVTYRSEAFFSRVFLVQIRQWCKKISSPIPRFLNHNAPAHSVHHPKVKACGVREHGQHSVASLNTLR